MAVASKTNERMYEYYCSSVSDMEGLNTDAISNGTVAYIIQDQEVYMWDSTAKDWIKQ